jgi:hypothetical protein
METVLVAEMYLPIEKPSVAFAPWLSRLNSEEHGERGEGEWSSEGGCHMIGSKKRSFAPLIHVSLEDLVPHNHSAC